MLNRTLHTDSLEADMSSASGVSWGAILAGASAAAALSFILVILGFGLGFSSVSPWSGSGLSAKAIGYSTIGWVAFTQIAASAIGGYMAGRLRIKWVNIHTEEVYFRDTAHGFLAWAVASLATAALLSSAVGGVLMGGAKVAGSAGEAAATVSSSTMDSNADGQRDLSGYFIDSLLRPTTATTTTRNDIQPTSANAPLLMDSRESSTSPAQRAEITRIFAHAFRTGSLSNADKTYLSQLLAKRTGMQQSDAEKRVSATYDAYKKNIDDATVKTKESADKARKAAAYGSLWMFIALLCGAFVASLAATYGGRLRDRVVIDEPVSRIDDAVQPVTLS